MKKKVAIFESFFDIAYLVVAFVIGIVLLIRSDISPYAGLAGTMALVLCLGDSFHLVPRVISNLSASGDFHAALGFGKLITSITMTFFYILLWLVGISYYGVYHPVWTAVLLLLAVVRIALCCLPQNGWLQEKPSVRWGIIRNIPFFVMGIMVVVLFFAYADARMALSYMWLAVLLSFAFYAPVVFFSQSHPKVGMLMAPKTCMYIWAMAMCLYL